jgi:protein-S-isoprenylcysteine O-methyltransferase Ste14
LEKVQSYIWSRIEDITRRISRIQMKKLIIPPVFVLLSLVLIVTFYFIFQSYNLIPFPFNLAGILIIIAGFVVMSKARDLFKKHQTTLTYNKASQLVTEGIFAKSRNPMYIGMFLMLLGTAICFMNLISVIVSFIFILIINFISVPIEERMMEDSFGLEYNEYKKIVRRWL